MNADRAEGSAKVPDEIREAVDEMTDALKELSIKDRLQVVRAILFERYGSRHSVPVGGPSWTPDPVMRGVVNILDGILEDVIRNPRAAILRGPEP